MENTIRFIAIYAHGFSFPMTMLIMGHGYEKKGLNHNALTKLYCPKMELPLFAGDRLVKGTAMYAGYLTVKDGEISVHKGGSLSLGIENDKQKNERLLTDVQSLKNIRSGVLSFYNDIASGVVMHAMLSR